MEQWLGRVQVEYDALRSEVGVHRLPRGGSAGEGGEVSGADDCPAG